MVYTASWKLIKSNRYRLALVDTLLGTAVAEEVLGGGDHVARTEALGIALAALQALDEAP